MCTICFSLVIDARLVPWALRYHKLCCRWNRLENLLVQGRKDRDFSAKDALQPVLRLLLGPDGEELRVLVIKESVRVTEAIVLGTVVDTYNSVPRPLRSLIFNGNGRRPLLMSDIELESMIELRQQVYRIWGLLRSSENFDPSMLQPILEVRTTSFGWRNFLGGVHNTCCWSIFYGYNHSKHY